MNYNVWNEMFKANQEMMNAWLEALPKREKGAEDSNKDSFGFGKYQEWVKFQNSWMENYKDMMSSMTNYSKWMESPYNVWTKMMNSYNPFELNKFMNTSTRDAFEKMLNSNKLYLGIYEQWEKFNKEILKPGTEDYKKNIDQLVDQFNNIFVNNLIQLLPKEMQGLMINTQNYFNTYIENLESFIGPWSCAYNDITDIYMESLYKDPMKLSNSLKEWKKAYDQTFGMLVKSPALGNSREILEQNNKALDAMIDMLVSMSEFIVKSLSVGYKHSKEAFEDYFESIENGEEPKTFNEFYNSWSNRVEKAIESYFYTDEFSKLIAKTADSAMIFKIEYDKVIEEALRDFPVVTKSQVDNVYKNVYELRKEVKSLNKKIEELEKKYADDILKSTENDNTIKK